MLKQRVGLQAFACLACLRRNSVPSRLFRVRHKNLHCCSMLGGLGSQLCGHYLAPVCQVLPGYTQALSRVFMRTRSLTQAHMHTMRWTCSSTDVLKVHIKTVWVEGGGIVREALRTVRNLSWVTGQRIRSVCDKVHGEKGHAKNAQKKMIDKYIPF